VRYTSKKLTEQQIIEIEKSTKTYRELAALYNVSRQTIATIKKMAGTQNPPSDFGRKAKATSSIFVRIKQWLQSLVTH
jgi:transposase